MAKSKKTSNSKEMYIYVAIAVLVLLVLFMFKFSNRASDRSMYQTPSGASMTSGNVDTDVQSLDQLMNDDSSSSDFDETQLK
jgi:uncharacterized protein YpmS